LPAIACALAGEDAHNNALAVAAASVAARSGCPLRVLWIGMIHPVSWVVTLPARTVAWTRGGNRDAFDASRRGDSNQDANGGARG
jgi:hypothetical protein